MGKSGEQRTTFFYRAKGCVGWPVPKQKSPSLEDTESLACHGLRWLSCDSLLLTGLLPEKAEGRNLPPSCLRIK